MLITMRASDALVFFAAKNRVSVFIPGDSTTTTLFFRMLVEVVVNTIVIKRKHLRKIFNFNNHKSNLEFNTEMFPGLKVASDDGIIACNHLFRE